VIVAACGAPSKPTPPPPPAPQVAAATPDAGGDGAVDAGLADPTCATSDECVALGNRILQAPVVIAHDPAAAVAANTRALALFRAACAQGQPVGCEMVGVLLVDYRYYGLANDGAGAAIAFDRACRLANGHACYRLGFYYWEGLLDHVVEGGRVRRIDWPNDRRIGVGLLHHACDDFRQPDACKLLVDLKHAGAI
jgi:TPR repeat protein